jgi:DUF1365 family protein
MQFPNNNQSSHLPRRNHLRYRNADQADASPARMTAEIRTIAIAVGLRKSCACLRVLLNAHRVSATASRGSSVNRAAKL